MPTQQNYRTVAVTDDENRWLEFYREVVSTLGGRRVFSLTDVEVRTDEVRGKAFAYVARKGGART